MADENIILSQQAADYQDLRQQLIDKAKTKGSFNTVISSSTGMMMVEFLAGIGAYSMFGIERALQELRRDDASDPISVYKLARTLGMAILRFRPSKTTALLVRADGTDLVSIPPYTEFTVDGSMTFVNSSAVVFAVGQLTATVEIQEGTEVPYDFTASGAEYQTLVFGSNFRASNDLIRVKVGGQEWRVVEDGLWNYGDEPVCAISTLPDGSIEAVFGNNTNGRKPTTGSAIQIVTYEVSGGELNSPRSNLKVSIPDFSTVSGTTQTRIDGGEGIRDIQYYRVNSPKVYAAAGRAVKRTDFSLLGSYAGIIDLKAVGEADIAPGDLRWQATVGICAITASPWTAAQKEAFIEWAEQKYTMYGLKMIWIEARKLPIRPLVQIIALKTADLASVKANVRLAISTYFESLLTAGSLGTSFYPTDLTTIIKGVSGVSKVVMTEPDDVTVAQYNDYVTLDPTFEVTGKYESTR